MSTVRKDVNIDQWLEIKYKGKVYLVAVKSLMEAYTERFEKTEREE